MTDLKKFFYANPVFRHEAFSRFMIMRGITSPNSWKKSLQYHVKTGSIILIKRGLYGVLNPMTNDQTTFYIDPFLIAGMATDDAVLAYHTALELHDIAYNTFETLTFLTHKQSKGFGFQSQMYQPIRVSEKRLKKSKGNFAVETIVRSSFKIKLTSLERTIVDVIDRPEISGGWEEIWRSLENLVTFDLNKLIDYLLLLNKANTVAKVGFFLESLADENIIHTKGINKLLKYIPKQPCYLDAMKERRKIKQNSLVKKWNLIVPDKIINKNWEENYEADF